MRSNAGTWGPSLFCALVIAACNLVSEIFRDYNHLQEFVQSGVAGRYALRAFIIAVVCFFICLFLFRLWDENQKFSFRQFHPHDRLRRFLAWRIGLSDKSLFLLIAVVLIVPWMLWAIAHFPGTMRDDTFAQLFQYYGVVGYYSQHPVFATQVFGAFWDLGSALGNPAIGLFIFIVLQIVITAFALSATLLFAMRMGMSHAIAIALVVFMALGRAFYQPVDTMSKDALNGWLFVFSLLCYMRIVYSRGSWLFENRCNAIVTVLAMTFCFATKRTLIFAFIGAFFILGVAVFALRKRRPLPKKSLRCAAIVFIAPVVLCVGVLQPVLNASLHVVNNKTFEMYSIPEQQIIRTLSEHPDALSRDEYDDLNRVMNVETAIGIYNPNRSDEVSTTMHGDLDRSTLIHYWILLSGEYPTCYLSSYAELASGWCSLSVPLNFAHEVNGDLLTPARITSWAKSFFDGDENAVKAFFAPCDFSVPSSLSSVNACFEKIDAWKMVHIPFFSSHGLFCFAVPLIVGAYLISRKRLMDIASLLPYFILLASLFVGPMVLYWYSIPFVYVAPLALGVPFFLRKEGHSLT